MIDETKSIEQLLTVLYYSFLSVYGKYYPPTPVYNYIKLAAPENLPGCTLWLPFFGVFAMGHSSSPHPDAHSLMQTPPHRAKVGSTSPSKICNSR